MNQIAQALGQQMQAGFRRLRFSPELERRFYQEHAETIVVQRLLLMVVGAAMVACSPFFDSLLLDPPAAYILEARRIQFGIILPAILLAFAFTADPRLRRWADPVGMTALLVVIVSWSYLRHQGLQMGHDVPVIMVGVLLAGALALAGAFFWAITPISVLGLVSFSTAELLARGPSVETLYELLGLFLLALVTSLSRYVQEYHQRANWLRRQHDRLHSEASPASDPLTGLPGAARLEQELPRILQKASGQRTVGILCVNLDHFRSINETAGRADGDRLLALAAERLRSVTGGIVFRQREDEFIVVLEDLGRQAEAAGRLRDLAERIRKKMSDPYVTADGTPLSMTASVGAAQHPEDGETAQALLTSVAAAMYQAKRRGRDLVQFANRGLTEETRRSLQMSALMRRGLATEEFEPWYQPVLDVRTGTAVGVEALLRWKSPEHGVVLAHEFISRAEDAGLIVEMGEFCLRRAYAQAAQWWQSGPRLPIAVNLSAYQLRDFRVLRLIDELQAAQPLAVEALQFEITESAMLSPKDQNEQVLQELRRRGYRLSIDDFGTGFSALSYLQRFPVTCIKIDRTFVTDLERSRASLAIVSATIALGRSLGLEVVAEGVETHSESERLQELGCVLQQGFLFAPAMPPSELEDWCAGRPMPQENPAALPPAIAD